MIDEAASRKLPHSLAEHRLLKKLNSQAGRRKANSRNGSQLRIKISVFTVFINYSKFKYIFNLYIKISLKVYEMKTFHFFFYRLDFF